MQVTLNALGFATSDIAEMGLTEISKTITALNRQNRIIVGQDRNEYNKVENNDERSLDDERTDLHDGGRLQPSEPETSTAAGSDAGQVRSDEERVSEGTSQSPLLQFTLDDGTGTDRTILSGIHAFYEPEELVGKTLIAITNLPPRAMMGIESCGMLLSAIHEEEGEEKLHLLMVDNHIPAGAKLY